MSPDADPQQRPTIPAPKPPPRAISSRVERALEQVSLMTSRELAEFLEALGGVR